ncbi:MAG TPA: DUF2911 domain-containing protein [Gemmatimonadaceae bacterium]
MKRSMFAGVALLAAAACTSAPASAQQATPKSQLGIVTQWIAGTKVEITYRRPVARGRALFGSLVPYGKVWTPSADTAARIAISGPIEINGARLNAGTYSMWATPDAQSWTMSFNSNAVLFHLTLPTSGEVLKVNAKPVASSDHIETLMFDFPMTDADSARLELRWGTTVIPFSIKAVR